MASLSLHPCLTPTFLPAHPEWVVAFPSCFPAIGSLSLFDPILTQLDTGPSKAVRLQSPESRNAKQIQSESTKPKKAQETSKPQPSKKEGDKVDSSVVQAMVTAALESIDSGGPGMRALGDPFMMVAQWPEEYSAAYNAVEEIKAERARAAAESAKPAEAYSDDDQPQGPARKKFKLNYRHDDRRDKGQ